MPDNPEKLLVLDLDETLIHSTLSRLSYEESFSFDRYFVYQRPLLEMFLNNIAMHYKVGIWSSAGDDYVQAISDQIKPPGINYEFVWGRSRCTLKRDMETDSFEYEKKLSKLKKKGFPLENILIVDDTHQKAKSNYGNAIYVKEFTGDPTDLELKYLLEYLMLLKGKTNFRTIEKRNWRHMI